MGTEVLQDSPPHIHAERPKDSPGSLGIFNSSCSRSQNGQGGAFWLFWCVLRLFYYKKSLSGSSLKSCSENPLSLGLPLTFVRVRSNGLRLLTGLPGDSPAWWRRKPS